MAKEYKDEGRKNYCISLIELDRLKINANTVHTVYKAAYTTLSVTSIFGKQLFSELLYRAAVNKINSSGLSDAFKDVSY